MNSIKWKKPSGIEIETNDLPATVAECERLGYERLTEDIDPVADIIKKMKTKDEIDSFVQTSYGLEVDTSGSIAAYKKRVIEAINGNG